MYALDYFSLFQAIPGVIDIQLFGSANNKISKKTSDLDSFVITRKGYEYVTRLLIKVLLKITGKDVHLWRAQLGIYFAAVIRYVHNDWSHSIKNASKHAIHSFKNRYHNTKIDSGIVTSRPDAVDDWYGRNNRVAMWLTERSYMVHDTPSAVQHIENKSNHILYNGKDLLFPSMRLIDRFKGLIMKIGWVVLYPVSLITARYYATKHFSNTNYYVNEHSICFPPNIGQEGYIIKVD
jgi:predicted nucleotidyltransferase